MLYTLDKFVLIIMLICDASLLSSLTTTSSLTPSSSSWRISSAVEQVVALYNYAAQHDDELTFAKASVINVLDKSDPDWWKGEVNGSTGVFPVNYVAPLSEAFPSQAVDATKAKSCE